MKRILIAGVSMETGGIEASLLSLVNRLASEYEITLALERKEGIFLEEVDKRVKIIEYRPSSHKNIFLRKVINLCKRMGFIRKYKKKFDLAISYATYSLCDSFMARTASDNAVLWVHSNYYILLGEKEEKVKEFFTEVKAEEFRKIIFVSEDAKNAVTSICKDLEGKSLVCYNFLNAERIRKMATEEIGEKKEEKITFLHVGRHTEEDKKITRILEAAEELKKQGYSFRVLLVGEGREDKTYQELVKEKNLEDTIFLLGSKKNPYPYYKISDALLVSSEYEGYPVVYLEAMLLGLPIITTQVSDSEQIIKGKYGMVVEKSARGVYQGMKDFLEKGYKVIEKWDEKAYNDEIFRNLKDLTQ